MTETKPELNRPADRKALIETINACDAPEPPKTPIPFGRIAEAIKECTNSLP